MVIDGWSDDVRGFVFPPFLNIFSTCSGGGNGIVATPWRNALLEPSRGQNGGVLRGGLEAVWR